MAEAILVKDNVVGHSGPGRVWQLDPPVVIDGQAHEHVCIWVNASTRWQRAEVITVASTESGAAVGGSVIRQPGSFVIPGDASTPEYIDGCHFVALQMLGGYTAVQPEVDESEADEE